MSGAATNDCKTNPEMYYKTWDGYLKLKSGQEHIK